MAHTASDLELRDCGECRVDLQEDRKIRGCAVSFNRPSENLGGFREVILPEAVDRTFKEAIDVRALVDHDSSKIIGRMKNGTLRLQKKPKGLFVEIDPADTTAGLDIVKSVNRGDVSGMSFAFRVIEDDWVEDENGMPLREVIDMRISEISIVTFPAYASTSVEVAKRSLQQFKATHTKATNWRAQYAEIQRLRGGY